MQSCIVLSFLLGRKGGLYYLRKHRVNDLMLCEARCLLTLGTVFLCREIQSCASSF